MRMLALVVAGTAAIVAGGIVAMDRPEKAPLPARLAVMPSFPLLRRPEQKPENEPSSRTKRRAEEAEARRAKKHRRRQIKQ